MRAQLADGRAAAAGNPEDANAPAVEPEGATDDRYRQLEQLGKLYEQDVLTSEEFAAEKAKLLGS